MRKWIQTFLFCVSDKFRDVSKNLLVQYGENEEGFKIFNLIVSFLYYSIHIPQCSIFSANTILNISKLEHLSHHLNKIPSWNLIVEKVVSFSQLELQQNQNISLKVQSILIQSVINTKTYEREEEQSEFYVKVISPFNSSFLSLKNNLQESSVLKIFVLLNGMIKGTNPYNVYILRKFYETHYDYFVQILNNFYSNHEIFINLFKYFGYVIQRQIKIAKFSLTSDFNHFSSLFSFIFNIFSSLKKNNFGIVPIHGENDKQEILNNQKIKSVFILLTPMHEICRRIKKDNKPNFYKTTIFGLESVLSYVDKNTTVFPKLSYKIYQFIRQIFSFSEEIIWSMFSNDTLIKILDMELFGLSHPEKHVAKESLLFIEIFTRVACKQKEYLQNISSSLPEILLKISHKLLDIGLDKNSQSTTLNSISLPLLYIFKSPFNVFNRLASLYIERFLDKKQESVVLFQNFSKELEVLDSEEFFEKSLEENVKNFIYSLSSLLY